MGKNLIQQRRGRGTSTFRAPSFRYVGAIKHKTLGSGTFRGKIVEFMHSQGHSAPVARIVFDDGEEILCAAALGLKIGDEVFSGTQIDVNLGNTLNLASIPEGTQIFNIESKPGDGGKFVRTSGGFAKIFAKLPGKIIVELPSKKQKEFNPECRATIGIIAGGGRTEKPLLKAGKHYHKRAARNKWYPRVCALSMNAVDHPYGGSRSSKKGKVTIARRHAPPGAKVGKLRPRRTGRRKA